MNTKLVGVQVVRFDPVTPGRRPHWRIAGFRPANGTLGLCWLGAGGWLPADGRNERQYRRFGTEAAARGVFAVL